jgi:hypothetical protein
MQDKNHNTIANKSLQNAAKVKIAYFKTIVRNKNYVHEEIKSRLNPTKA